MLYKYIYYVDIVSSTPDLSSTQSRLGYQWNHVTITNLRVDGIVSCGEFFISSQGSPLHHSSNHKTHGVLLKRLGVVALEDSATGR